MADDMDVGEQRKPSALKTVLWAAAAVAALVVLPHILGGILGHGLIMGAVKIGAAIFAGSKAWQSHKENQAIEAQNSRGIVYNQAALDQDRSLAIQQAQDQDVAMSSTRWQDAEAARRGASINAR